MRETIIAKEMTWLCVVAYPWGGGGSYGKEDPLKLDLLMECFKISLFAGNGHYRGRACSLEKTWGILHGVNHHHPDITSGLALECMYLTCGSFQSMHLM